MAAQGTIPRQVDSRRAAHDAATFEGTLGLHELPRTRAVAVADSQAEISVSLAFAEDEQRRVTVTGQVGTTLSLPCQRCLEPANVAMDVAVAGMVVVSDEAAANVPRRWEPVLVESERVDLHALVDDELLLAMPITVQCDRPACAAMIAQYTTDEPDMAEDEAADPAKSNPFAVLAELKSHDNDSN